MKQEQLQQHQQQLNASWGGGCPSCIEGSWVLDLSRSETMHRYLEFTGVPEEEVTAHVRAERSHGALNVIRLSESTFTIYKQTYANNYTEMYEIGEEKVTHHSNTGARKSDMVSIADSGRGGFVRSARTTTKFGEDDKQMIETRCVIEDGLSHNQEILFRNLITGEECVTTRIWRRVPMTDQHFNLTARTPAAK